MAQLTNIFSKGLNKDINKIDFPNDKYYHLQNGRILTDKGTGIFSISNIEGNTREVNLTNYYNNFSIIGYVNVRENIVLFLANDNNRGEGVILLLKNKNDHFVPLELYRNKELKFYKGHPIQNDMVVSRYESPETIKIYWTDGLNNLRFLNIAPDVNTSGDYKSQYSRCSNTPLNQLEFISEINFTVPIFNGFIGGSLNAGMIQYAYRLYNLKGSETIFSPASELIPLTKYPFSSGTSKLRGHSTSGQALDTNTGKGVSIKIELSEDDVNNFDKIEIISLWYADRNGLPIISIIDKKDVARTIYCMDEGGVVEYGGLEISEYRNLIYDFSCKTLAVKDNRLFAGNIIEKYFDINYDAKVFRYDISNKSDIYDNNGSYRYRYNNGIYDEYELVSGDPYTGNYITTGNTFTSSDLEVKDCVNVYNLTAYDNIVPEYKYQSNGTTLGGEGVNISYYFPDDMVYKIEDNSYVRALNTNITNVDSSITINGKYYNHIGNRDWIYGSKKSFLRGEIYRFGIVFYDNKGRSSFVKWIGDIRMPSNSDIPFIVSDDTGIYARPLFPVFEVLNIPSIDNKKLDYQIVYVKRTKEDKTIISQGIGGGIIKENEAAEFYLAPFEITDIQDYLDDQYTDPSGATLTKYNKYLIEYNSPDINFDVTFNNASSYLEINGAIKKEGILWRRDNDPNWYPTYVSFAGDESYQIVRKYSQLERVTGTTLKNSIVEFKTLIPGPELTTKTNFSNYIYNHYVRRLDAEGHAGFRGTSSIIYINNAFISTDYGLTTPGDYIFSFNMRNDTIPYNGNTYEDRTTNKYIPAGSLNANECYNGDTFICMYDYLRAIYDETISEHKIQEVIYFPVETQYNLFFRFDDSYSRIYNLPEDEIRYLNEIGYTNLPSGIDFTPLYDGYYDGVKSKLDESRSFIPRPLDYVSMNYYDCLIKYSELKLNNEERDSWIKFKPNNFNEVNANYGSLNSLVEFNDNIFCFQESGISIASINKQSLISDNAGVELVLGKGDILDTFQYLNTEIGIQGLNKVIKSLQALYWLDLNKKKIYQLSNGIESLDDIKGLNSWFEYGLSKQSILKGIYDSKYSEVLFTISNIKQVKDTIIGYTKPSCTIKFTKVLENNKIILYLNNTKYTFIASNTTNTGTFFKVGSTLSDTIDNFVIAINRVINPGINYDVTKNGNEVSIVGLIDGLGNIQPSIEVNNLFSLDANDPIIKKAGIGLHDYSNSIINPNSVLFVDCVAGGAPDKFEILVGGSDDGPTYVVASTHQTNVKFLNGRANGILTSQYDPASNYDLWDDDSKEWYIGTDNTTTQPIGIDEFNAVTGLNIPKMSSPVEMDTQQRIWVTGISPGDKVYVRTRGINSWTVSAIYPYIVDLAEGNIDIISTSDIKEVEDVIITYEKSSILDATGNNTLLNVEDSEYYNLRVGNKYSINNLNDVKILDINSSSFNTNKLFSGNIDLSYYAKYNDNFTVAYNEAIGEFTGFYDFLPNLYIKFNKGFFTTINDKELWKHNEGTQCSFYGKIYDTYIDIIVNDSSSFIKEFNNIEFYSEIYKEGKHLPNETLYSIQVENDYQQSEEVVLYPLSDDNDLIKGDTRTEFYTEGDNIPISSVNFNNLANIRRSIDHWRTSIPRTLFIKEGIGDYSSKDYNLSDYYIYGEAADTLNNYDRIRSPYCKIRLKFKNEDDKKFILHKINTLIQPMIV